MPQSPNVLNDLQLAVFEATLHELGGEDLAGSGFEQELPVELDAEPAEGDAQ